MTSLLTAAVRWIEADSAAPDSRREADRDAYARDNRRPAGR